MAVKDERRRGGLNGRHNSDRLQPQVHMSSEQWIPNHILVLNFKFYFPVWTTRTKLKILPLVRGGFVHTRGPFDNLVDLRKREAGSWTGLRV